MEVSPHVDTVVHRVVHAGYGIEGVIDSPAVIGSGDAIFGDDYRRAFGDVPSMADGCLLYTSTVRDEPAAVLQLHA